MRSTRASASRRSASVKAPSSRRRDDAEVRGHARSKSVDTRSATRRDVDGPIAAREVPTAIREEDDPSERAD